MFKMIDLCCLKNCSSHEEQNKIGIQIHEWKSFFAWLMVHKLPTFPKDNGSHTSDVQYITEMVYRLLLKKCEIKWICCNNIVRFAFIYLFVCFFVRHESEPPRVMIFVKRRRLTYNWYSRNGSFITSLG